MVDIRTGVRRRRTPVASVQGRSAISRRQVLAGGGMIAVGLAATGGGSMMRSANAAQVEADATPAADSMRFLTDRTAIVHVVDEIDNAVDAKDWTTCRSYFLDEIDVDFTSLAGGSPGRIPADELVGMWSTNLYRDKLSHHMRSNHRVTIDGDRAEVFSKGYALNILSRRTGSDLWEVWGDYVHTLRRTDQGWKCAGMALVVTYARGNETARDFVPGQ